MSHPLKPEPPPPRTERRAIRRGPLGAVPTVVLGALRTTSQRVRDFRLAVGVFLFGGALVAIAGIFAFVWVATTVERGATQPADDAIMRWMGAHRVPWVEHAFAEITLLGTGIVVLTVVGVAALFLWLTRHKYSATLLLVATGGGIALNNILKLAFDRPRPQLFPWATRALSSSFPSGHAMSSTIVYVTVAYLAARLQRRRSARALTMLVAVVIVALVCASRVYLGVHYPSDVGAGIVIGLAWAGLCLAALEAIQIVGHRRAPHEMREQELPASHMREGPGPDEI
jgi:undecaprenyl-diphosphatase